MSIWTEIKKKIKNGEQLNADEVIEEILKSANNDNANDTENNTKKDSVESYKSEQNFEEKVEKNADELISKDDSKNSYDNNPLATPKYEKLTYTPPTDEEIDEQAKNSLESYKNSTLSTIDENAKSEKNKISKEIEDGKNKASEKQIAIEQSYAETKENINNDMLRRGLARSSVATLLNSQNENDKLSAITKLRNESEKEITSLNEQIAQAEQKRKKAIDDFNIEYAVKYSAKVEELKQERDKKQREVIEFNNAVEQKSYDDKLDGIKLYEQLKENEKANNKNENSGKEEGKTEDNDGNSNQNEDNKTEEEKQDPSTYTDLLMYEIFRNHLLALSPQEAYNAVRNHAIYSSNLSTLSYLKLLEEFGR